MINQLLNQISKDLKELKDAITEHYELYISAFTALLLQVNKLVIQEKN
jgi:hypothetical protein